MHNIYKAFCLKNLTRDFYKRYHSHVKYGINFMSKMSFDASLMMNQTYFSFLSVFPIFYMRIKIIFFLRYLVRKSNIMPTTMYNKKNDEVIVSSFLCQEIIMYKRSFQEC